MIHGGVYGGWWMVHEVERMTGCESTFYMGSNTVFCWSKVMQKTTYWLGERTDIEECCIVLSSTYVNKREKRKCYMYGYTIKRQ